MSTQDTIYDNPELASAEIEELLIEFLDSAVSKPTRNSEPTGNRQLKSKKQSDETRSEK